MVQQRGGGPDGPAPEINPSAPHERDAHAAAMAVASGRPQARITTSTGVGLAGEWDEGKDIARVAADHLEDIGSGGTII